MSIRWIGGIALVAAAGVAALLATAQAQDRIVNVRQRADDISAGQKSALATAANSIFPGITGANTTDFSCSRYNSTKVRCAAKETKSGNAAAYFVDKDTAGLHVELDSWNGSTAAWKTVRVNDDLSAADKTALAAAVTALWPSAVLANVTSFLCSRDKDVTTEINCALHELQTKSEADALTALTDNPGSEVVGVVE